MTRKALLGLVAALALCGQVLAGGTGAETGGEYLGLNAQDRQLYAAGFLAGINYFYLYATGERYCLPPDMTGQAMAALIEGYLREHPEEIYQDMDYLAFKAVIAAYPLPKPWR